MGAKASYVRGVGRVAHSDASRNPIEHRCGRSIRVPPPAQASVRFICMMITAHRIVRRHGFQEAIRTSIRCRMGAEQVIAAHYQWGFPRTAFPKAVTRVFRFSCIHRSFAAFWLLRNAGASVELKIGVNCDSASPEWHCWVELDGKPLNENTSRFGELWSYRG